MAAGGLRVNGTDLEWRDAGDTVRSVTGTLIGSSSDPAGSLRLVGDEIQYVDANGDERHITADGFVSTSIPDGAIGVFSEDLRWTDNGHKHFLVPVGLTTGDFVPDADDAIGAWNEDDGDGNYFDEIDEGDPHDGDTSYISFSSQDTPQTETASFDLEPVSGTFREFQTKQLIVVARMAATAGTPSFDMTARIFTGVPSAGATPVDTVNITGRTDTSYFRWTPAVSGFSLPDSSLYVELEATLDLEGGDIAEFRCTAFHLQVS